MLEAPDYMHCLLVAMMCVHSFGFPVFVCEKKEERQNKDHPSVAAKSDHLHFLCSPFSALHPGVDEWLGVKDSDGGRRDDPDKRRAEGPASKLSLFKPCDVATRPVAETRQYRRRRDWGGGLISRGRIAVMALFISVISRERDVGQVASSTDESSSAGFLWSRGR